MRPIRLELENFTIYRGKHSIDFSPLNFFAIKGKTGAGKTSLIDAICYALYGKVPRYGGERAHAYLVSKGQRFMRVSLEFSVRGRRYKIEREYVEDKRRNLSEFRFYEEGKPKPFRERELEDYLKNVLRLDYSIFTKVILLPQNQFDRFLKPQNQRERREILNSLLGFSELILALKDLVGQEYKLLVGKLQLMQQRFEQLAYITPELILQREKELENVKKEYKELSEGASKLTNLLLKCKERDSLLQEYKKTSEDLDRLLTQEEDIARKKQLLETVLEILPYLPKVEQYESLLLQEEKLKEEKKEKELDLKKYHEERELVEQEFKSIEVEFKKLESYNNKRLEISQTLQLIEQYMGFKRDLEKIEGDIRHTEEQKDLYMTELKDLRERSHRGYEKIRDVEYAIQELEEKGVEQEFIQSQRIKEQVENTRRLEKEEEQVKIQVEILEKELKGKEEKLNKALKEREELELAIGQTEGDISNLRSFIERESELLQEGFRLKEQLSKALELKQVSEERAIYEKRLQELEKNLSSIEEQLEGLKERRIDVYAFEIRSRLTEGDVCPVCGHRVEHIELKEQGEDITSLIKRQEELEKTANSLRSELLENQAKVSILKTKEKELQEALYGLSTEDIQGRLSQVEGILKEIEEKKRLLRDREQTLRNLKTKHSELSKFIDNLKFEEGKIREEFLSKNSILERLVEEKNSLMKSLGEVLDVVLERVKKAEKEYEELRLLKERERKFKQRFEEIQKELMEKEKKYTELEERLKGLIQQKRSLEEKLMDLGNRIIKATGESPSELLAHKLRKQSQELERRVKEVQESYETTSSYLQRLREQEARLISDIQNIERMLSQLQSQKQSMASEIYSLQERFGSLQNLKSCALSQEQIKSLQQEIEEYNKERHNLENKLKELELKLQGLKELPETFRMEEDLKGLEASIEENRRLHGSLDSEIKKLKEDLSEKQSLEKSLSELRMELSLYERLRSDLVDNQFPEYVSQLMLKRIVDRASYYLFKFTSGLFTFDLLEGDLHVYDHSTGYHRIVSSLSGGETFLASLSLAFAVADILSQNAPLESLFIDEGFGSLDRETRDSLSEFFDMIRQSTDRLVGVITHVEDIAEKFSQRIEVEKREGYAKLKVIY
ncbi:AAA family ATPase [Hydrogenobacter sp. T-2]|uniref:AAA family ATPase n=1 Tax=Pampinifervens diazotrophicum TaxID=1632018 RepID=UPI002B2618E3|nr:AAA family ATPase [Hydrogenobacter sp. T-2]WPM31747.1 AAA family ATPase [Hydrogenobacter sp. T-2]